MKNWEAMVRVDEKDCYDCSPKGTTKSGSHANIVHMVAPPLITSARNAILRLKAN